MFRRTHQQSFVLTLLACSALALVPGSAAADCFLSPWFLWTSPPPGVGSGPVMVYDSARNITVSVFHNGRTFEIINDQWIERETAQVNPWNFQATKPKGVYRSAQGDVLLITAENQVLSWDGVVGTWTYHAEPPFPMRANPAVAYDPHRDVVILFGGQPVGGGQLDDTWEYDGETWTQIVTPTTPPARRWAPMAFDTHRNVAVMFGGGAFVAGESLIFGDTWEYNGVSGDWTEVDHSAYPSPPDRRNGGLVYHPGLQATVLVHGIGPEVPWPADFWLFDGTKWIERFPDEAHWATGTQMDMVYNASKNAIQKVMSSVGEVIVIETGAFAPQIVQQPLNQAVQQGKPVQFSVGVHAEQGPIAYQWRHNGKPIPGATLSVYTIGSAMPSHTGAYDCVITPSGFGDVYCGKSISIAGTLIVTPTCAADLNGDGNVGIADLLQLLSAWGPCND